MANNIDLKEQERLQQERVEERVSKVEKFFNENKKTIWGTLIAILVIGLIVLCYQKFYAQPRRVEAAQQLFPAEAAFRAGEWDLALNGDGNNLGLAEIASTYGNKAGKAVWLYAGISELQLGNYEEALNYLKKYSGKDKILAARALGAQGDALCGLQKYSEAVAAFEKAAGKVDDIFAASYLLKAGVASEELGNDDKALAFYKKIKDQYSNSLEGYEIDKYISRLESKIR